MFAGDNEEMSAAIKRRKMIPLNAGIKDSNHPAFHQSMQLVTVNSKAWKNTAIHKFLTRDIQ